MRWSEVSTFLSSCRRPEIAFRFSVCKVRIYSLFKPRPVPALCLWWRKILDGWLSAVTTTSCETESASWNICSKTYDQRTAKCLVFYNAENVKSTHKPYRNHNLQQKKKYMIKLARNLIKCDSSLSLYKFCLHFSHVARNMVLCLLNFEKYCHGSLAERTKI